MNEQHIMQNRIFLIHGFNKGASDMYPLERSLASFGYDCLTLNYPLRFHPFENATAYLRQMLNRLPDGEQVFLVGHSTGGLVIRDVLSSPDCAAKVKRAVLIATPSQGSQLARHAHRVQPFTRLYKTIASITPEFVGDYAFQPSDVEMGAIAGDRSNLFLGKMIREQNDGRVETSSVYDRGLKDFLVLPYGHKDIHHRRETAEFVHRFLQTGMFYG
ncbi:alpha/beta fold hydrolase [Jeotgalibacillus sp. R-1-5s-1]|uniref:alpha/beta fold hydrolase n=1 Tax=Jeotgalibacillus sp. R-1-5s-1 TaxID=2555897 RepID=UPI00141BE2B4|nr:alpha/beta fold hydrolase [Jeotgalibacillus sp. R-1-5s-1]